MAETSLRTFSKSKTCFYYIFLLCCGSLEALSAQEVDQASVRFVGYLRERDKVFLALLEVEVDVPLPSKGHWLASKDSQSCRRDIYAEAQVDPGSKLSNDQNGRQWRTLLLMLPVDDPRQEGRTLYLCYGDLQNENQPMVQWPQPFQMPKVTETEVLNNVETDAHYKGTHEFFLIFFSSYIRRIAALKSASFMDYCEIMPELI